MLGQVKFSDKRVLAVLLIAAAILTTPRASMAAGEILYDDDFSSLPIGWNLYAGTSGNWANGIFTFSGSGTPGMTRPSTTPWPCPAGAVVHLLLSANSACTVRIRVGSEGQTHSLPGDGVFREYTLTLATPQSGVNFYRASGTASVSVDRAWVTAAPGLDLYLQGVSQTSGVSLSWSPGSPPYTVSRSGNVIGTTSNTSYLDPDAPWGTTCDYEVTDSATGTGQVSVVTLPAPPIVQVTATTTTSISLAWDSVPTATSYNVYRNGLFQGNQADITFVDGNLAPSTTFTYTVAAVSSVGTGRKSDPVQATTTEQPPPPTAPTNLRLIARGTSSVSVAWDAVAGVGGYKVYLDGGLYTLTPATSATISGLVAGSSHVITVQAYSGIYDGALSTPLSVTTIGFPGAVQDLAAVPAPSSVSLTWSAPATPDPPVRYKVYRDQVLVAEPTTMGHVATGLAPQTSYLFGVSAVTAAGEGPVTEITVTTTMLSLDAPTGLQTSSSPRTINLTWQAVGAATSYKCYLDGQYIGQTAACKYLFTGLVPERAYTVSVSAVNQDGESDEATTVGTTGPGEATLTASAYGAGYIARWSLHSPAVADMPDLYRLYVDDVIEYEGLQSFYGDDDPGWDPETSHEVSLEAVYAGVPFTSTATVTSLAGGNVSGDDTLHLASFSIRSLWPLLAVVTACSVAWISWDRLTDLMGR